jgi:hypothetical protein
MKKHLKKNWTSASLRRRATHLEREQVNERVTRQRGGVIFHPTSGGTLAHTRLGHYRTMKRDELLAMARALRHLKSSRRPCGTPESDGYLQNRDGCVCRIGRRREGRLADGTRCVPPVGGRAPLAAPSSLRPPPAAAPAPPASPPHAAAPLPPHRVPRRSCLPSGGVARAPPPLCYDARTLSDARVTGGISALLPSLCYRRR